MRIAIAGTGDLAKYFAEELLKASYEVVVLSRGSREWYTRPDISLRVTDYSIPLLVEQLSDCDGLVSAIQEGTLTNVTVHLALLEACKQTACCKRFIPTEYIGNVDDFPEQPLFYGFSHQPIRDALANQKDVTWTLLNPGWLADYVVPPRHRYIRDIGNCHPIAHDAGTMVIPGTGDEPISCTAARDVAKAVATFFQRHDWEPVTYVSGEATTWNGVKELLETKGYKLQVSYCPLARLEQTVEMSKSEDEVLAAQFGLWSTSGSTRVPEAKTTAQKSKFFRAVQFRALEQLVDEAAQSQEPYPI